MLWEIRGCDGNLNGWTGSRGRGDDTRSIVSTKKSEVGAYVVNSNGCSGDCNSYFQVNNNRDFTIHPSSNHYRSKRPSIPDVWPRQPMDSMESLLCYPMNHGNTSNTQSVLGAKQPSNLINSANYQTRLNSSGFSVQPGNSLAFVNSVPIKDLVSDQSIDRSSLGNIYQGTVVRVKVPESYAELAECNASIKENDVNRQEVSRAKHFQQETRDFNSHEVHGGPFPVKANRHINDWLRNCQQFSDDKSSQSTKLVLGTQKVNHPNTHKITQQQVVIASKPNYGVSIQSKAVSNSRFSEEPRIVAGLESKTTKTKVAENPSSHRQRSTSMVWTGHNDLTHLHERQRSRSFEVENSFTSTVMAQQTKDYLECDLSPTSSEWSSETLSMTGSDQSSYCTDFTPFEFEKNIFLHTQGQKTASEFEQDLSSIKRRNNFVSQISVEPKPLANKSARETEFSQNSERSSPSAHLSEESNTRPGNHELQSKNSEDKTRKHRVIKINSPTRNPQTCMANRQVGEDQSSHVDMYGHDDTALFVKETKSQKRFRHCQPTMHPQDKRICEQNSKNLEGSGHKNASADILDNVSKLSKDERNRLSDHGVERPRSLTKFTKKDQPLSIVPDNISSRQVNEGKRTASNSRPVTQLKNGSLSITIRPTYPTVFEIFDNLDGAENSSYPRNKVSQKEIGKHSSEIAVLQGIKNKPSETLKNLDNIELIPIDTDSAPEIRDASSQDSGKLHTYTRTFVHTEGPTNVSSSASKTGRHLKLVSKRNQPAKTEVSSLLTNIPIHFEQFASEKQSIQIASDIYKHADCKDNERPHVWQSAQFDENPLMASHSSTILSSESSSKAHNVNKILSFERIFENASSHVGEKLENSSIDHDYKCKNNSVGSLEGENKAGSKNKLSELLVSSTTSQSRSKCKQLESCAQVQISSTDNGDEMQKVPSEFSYNESQDKTEDMSHVSDYEISRLRFDPLRSGDNALETRNDNEINSSPNTFLVSLQANEHQDLQDFKESSKPQLQTPIYASQFNVEPAFMEDLADRSTRHLTDLSEEDSGSDSASPQPRDSETSKLSDIEFAKNDEIHAVNCLQTDCTNKSLVLDSTASPQEFSECCTELEDNSDNVFMTDSVSLVSEVLKAFDDIQRKGRELLDSKSEDLCSIPDADASTSGHRSKEICEQMSCQEFVELHQNLVIEPPMSFSDFTITL